MTFESEGLLIVAIYIWLPPASYVVFSDNSGFLYLTSQNFPSCLNSYFRLFHSFKLPTFYTTFQNLHGTWL